MTLPIRLVCGACLESVEASIGEGGRPPAYCPSCGSRVESGIGHRLPWSDPTSEYPTDPSSSLPASPVISPDAETRRELASVGRFRIGKWIGGGGYGDVYVAFDPRLERDVALKVLKPTKVHTKAKERFLREARAAARLDHPSIVGLHDAGEDDGRLWIAYQLVRGQTLARVRDAGTLDIRQTVALVRDLADALHHAHRRGVFHRDLKPANVLIDEHDRPRLTDFGLARRLDDASELTGEGTVLGTPAYMSPEQAEGRANLADARSDVYSLGVILYELICGRRPADAPSNAPAWKRPRHTTPPTPHSVDRAIPRSLDRICMKALAIHPEDRFPDARCFSAALAGWLGRSPASDRRRGGILAVGLLIVAGIASALPGASQHHGEPTPVARTVASPVPPRSGPPAAPASPVIVNTQSLKFHLPDCPTLKNRGSRNWIDFPSLDEARAAGDWEPCKTCKPRP